MNVTVPVQFTYRTGMQEQDRWGEAPMSAERKGRSRREELRWGWVCPQGNDNVSSECFKVPLSTQSTSGTAW